jgi:predicted nucleic acid-binding protein
MILVDSSVWIAHFRGIPNAEAIFLETALAKGFPKLLTGDLILAEVLQGFRSDRQVKLAIGAFDELDCLDLGGRPVAIQAARNYRLLRGRGITVRSTIDCLIATFCIKEGLSLLHDDRDFEPFSIHLGLETVPLG